MTTLDEGKMNQVKGGIYIVRGRQFTYRTRWTSVDTRADHQHEVMEKTKTHHI
ncbi:MAG: hypothetical protein IT260_21675 [Saprospiraceae bacterium]|nr:hypothetical protein [Saprospiraceae bacterium]